MRRNASVPQNFHSQLNLSARAAVSGEVHRDICGFVLLRATRGARKALRVQLVAEAGALVIRLVQVVEGQRHTFELCRLDYRWLAVGWLWNDLTAFVLAAVHEGRLYHEIYCYPENASRNAWLRVFEAKRVLSMPLFNDKWRPASPEQPSIAGRLVISSVRERCVSM